MQIHELTQRQLNEASIADTIKSAGSAVKTGVQNMQNRQAVANVERGAAAQAKTQTQAAKYAEILKSRGYTGKPAAVPAVTGPQTITAAIGNTAGEYTKTGQTWTNELGQQITEPNSIAYLDSILADENKTAAVDATSAMQASAGPVMTSVEVDQAIRRLGLSQQQLNAFQAQAQQNTGFVQAFLKRLGLK